MISPNISFFKNSYDTKPINSIPLDIFIENTKNGTWMNDVIDYRSGKKDKKTLFCATLSGEFSSRNAEGLSNHSGYLVIDLDKVEEIDVVKSRLATDKYVHAMWKSVSGNGLALLFKVDPRKHLQAFRGLEDYLFSKYDLVVDPSGKDVSRLRYVSYDPDLYTNWAAAKFNIYPKEEPKAIKKLPKVIFVKNDFDNIIRQISERHIDITDDYHLWRNVAFAFADKFGDYGEEYFHLVSRNSPKYDYKKCKKQYEVCLRHSGHGITMATFYWLCKEAGIQTISEETKLIATSASQGHKKGLSKKAIIDNLKNLEGISEEKSSDVVDQVVDNNIDFKPEGSFIFQLETWLRQNFEIRKNLINRKMELNEIPMEQSHYNTIFMDGKKQFDKELSYELFDRLLHSDFTPKYNPIIDWFEMHKELHPEGNIDKLCRSIVTDQPFEYVKKFVTKWLVGIIEAIYTTAPPLMLVLAGSIQGTGKTEFFRRLLPDGLKEYYAESKLDKDKDDEILMTQKLIIMDDEMSGKSKRDVAKLKALTSKSYFSLREPYGRVNVDLKRLAVLCGTSNDTSLLSDPTGNRRIIIIHVLGILFDSYNAIDKTDLFMEVYWLWKEGKENSYMSREDIKFLNDQTISFEEISLEKELVQGTFEPSSESRGIFLTTTDIKINLEKHSSQKLNIKKLGQELKNLGFEQKQKKTKGVPRRGYFIRFTDNQNFDEENNELPF